MIDRMDNVQAIVPLTPAQRALLYQTLVADSDALYRTQSRDNIHGVFNPGLFRQAIEYLVARHESLRCLFLHAGLEEPAAIVRQQVPLQWREIDLQHLSDTEQQVEAEQIAASSLEEPLPLDQAPLLRITLIRFSRSLSRVIFDIHHLIFDGWSSAVFFTELQIVYQNLQSGTQPALPEAGKFSDYAHGLAGLDVQKARAFWATALKGFDNPTALPLDYSSTSGSGTASVSSFTNASFRKLVAPATRHRLAELCRSNRLTMSTLLEAVWALLLARYNNTDDVALGVALNGRSASLPQHERTFGMFVNALPFRLRCAASDNLLAWLEKAQTQKALLLGHEHTSAAEVHLVSELPAGIALFETLLVYQSFPALDTVQTPALQFSNVGVHENNPIPLLIDIFDAQQLELLIVYNSHRLPEQQTQQIIGHYLNLLDALARVTAPENACLRDLNMLSAEDNRRLLDASAAQIPQNQNVEMQTLHAVFLDQVTRVPDRIAVSDMSEQWTYRQLFHHAHHICCRLQEHGIGQGDVVAVSIERSLLMYPAILGVMMAGAVYLPLDPGYPPARRHHMLSDSQACLILSDCDGFSPSQGFEHTLQVINLSRHWQLPVDDMHGSGVVAGDLAQRIKDARSAASGVSAAYLMYTSGSTGLAKGVLGSHQATLNRLQWQWRCYPWQANEVCCQKTSLSFVDSIAELFGPLLAGIPTVVLSDDTVQQVPQFVDMLEQQRVSRVVLLPSLLSVLLDSMADLASRLRHLQFCTVSGEPLSADLAEQFRRRMPHCRLLNLYGSTEVSADVTAMEIDEQWRGPIVSIGRPLSGCSIYILDHQHRLMPPGAIGELAVAGAGLSLGYYGSHSGLNQQKFIDNPFGEGRLFLTGDRGRFLPDGRIVHCGRADKQFKVRGMRVEPAEIEQALASYPGIRTALVDARPPDRLYAYYRTKDDQQVDTAALMAHASARLPGYMMPAAIMAVDDFPRLPNGKINRKALPVPQAQLRQPVAPRTETEKQLATIWCEVLDGEPPSIHDNFVEAGGSSLSGMRLNARVHQAFGTMIMPRLLLTGTLAQLAAHINPADSIDKSTSAPVVGIDKVEPLFFGQSPYQLFGVLHEPLQPGSARAVLLVPSIGHEYMRLQRSYQQLATELARQGYWVLRFDFYGFGDSKGHPAEASVQRWRQDIADAAGLLLSRSSASKLTGVAVRLAGPMILGARPDKMDEMILWDPVVSGKRFWDELGQLHHSAMHNLDRYRFHQRRSARWERFGYTYSAALAEQICQLSTPPLMANSDARLHVISTSQATLEQLRPVLEARQIGHHLEADEGLWTDPEQASYLAFVQPVLNRIKASISRS